MFFVILDVGYVVEGKEIMMVQETLENLTSSIQHILKDKMVGMYIHGSLVLGGFQHENSDIDIIIITNQDLTFQDKKRAVSLFLSHSLNPFPIEVSILPQKDIHNWRHPCPYLFHYSEYWRTFYEQSPEEQVKEQLLHDHTDSDLAAHLTVLFHYGKSIFGKPIDEVFQPIPEEDYLDSLKREYHDCMNSIKEKPIYCVLNLLRIEYYFIHRKIISKHEAAQWGIAGNHAHRHESVEIFKVVNHAFHGNQNMKPLNIDQLEMLKDEFDIICSQFYEKKEGE